MNFRELFFFFLKFDREHFVVAIILNFITVKHGCMQYVWMELNSRNWRWTFQLKANAINRQLLSNCECSQLIWLSSFICHAERLRYLTFFDCIRCRLYLETNILRLKSFLCSTLNRIIIACNLSVTILIFLYEKKTI